MSEAVETPTSTLHSPSSHYDTHPTNEESQNQHRRVLEPDQEQQEHHHLEEPPACQQRNSENVLEDNDDVDDNNGEEEDMPNSKKRRKNKKSSSKFRKAPQAPKRFKSPYILFSVSKMEEIKDEGGTVTSNSRKIAEAWRHLSAEERKKWDAKAKQDKIRYNAEKSLYTGPWQVPSKRVKKDPSAPKRPMSAFLFFSQGMRPKLKGENPEMKNTEISCLLGQRWKNASEEEKRPHVEREQREREQYKKDIAEWRSKRDEEDKAMRKRRQEVADQYVKSGFFQNGFCQPSPPWMPQGLLPPGLPPQMLQQQQQGQQQVFVQPAANPASSVAFSSTVPTSENSTQKEEILVGATSPIKTAGMTTYPLQHYVQYVLPPGGAQAVANVPQQQQVQPQQLAAGSIPQVQNEFQSHPPQQEHYSNPQTNVTAVVIPQQDGQQPEYQAQQYQQQQQNTKEFIHQKYGSPDGNSYANL